MALPLWLHACTLWYLVSNAIIAYKSWPALPGFFAACYIAGLFGGLGDHVEPYVPAEYHAYTTQIMENYIGRFPLALSAVAILLRFCTLDSVSLGSKLRSLAMLVAPLVVLISHKPTDYNTDWMWHLVHSTVVHGLLLAANLRILGAMARHSSKRVDAAAKEE
ncbi:hypothetical protein BOX15_Mlig030516g3 [Macrostomum lignano]|uniref:Transmembrane protein n=1 Tax=Macrostomum lignano TaxID=282301 RepID=A0A267DM25_9PLAT|nr:hypothetical protein BOX15_Mlig030516g4 [Macrostomum lignano]PAA49606.1 hypothetical protein BOX15_Mlig030516g3 [Macrostomum lignano]